MIPDYRLLCMYFASYILKQNWCWTWSDDTCPLWVFVILALSLPSPLIDNLYQSLKRHLIWCSYILIYVDLIILYGTLLPSELHTDLWKYNCIQNELIIGLDIIHSAVSGAPCRWYHTHIHRQIPLGNFDFEVKPNLFDRYKKKQ